MGKLNTGQITSALVALTLNEICQGLTFIMPNLYANAVLSTLNARKHLRPLLYSSSGEQGGQSVVGSRFGCSHNTTHTESQRAEASIEIDISLSCTNIPVGIC